MAVHLDVARLGAVHPDADHRNVACPEQMRTGCCPDADLRYAELLRRLRQMPLARRPEPQPAPAWHLA